MRKLSAFLVVSCLALCQQITPAAQWFLDNSSGLGNDSNNCTSRATPCLTVAGLLAKSIQAGNLVAVRCTGTAFREEFVVPQNNVGLTTYDCQSLAAPVFDAADIISAGAWSKTGGQTVTYQASSLPVAFAGDSWVNVWENGTVLIYESSIAAVDANAGSYFASSESVSPITIYVHASDGSNPGTNGKVYTYSNRQTGYNSSAVTGASVYGIVTQNNSLNDGSLKVGPSGFAYNVTANNGSKHNVLHAGNSILYGVTAHNSYFNGQASIMFVYNENIGNGESIRCSMCSAVQDSFSDNSVGVFGHTNTSGDFGQIVYESMSCTLVGVCFGGGSLSSMMIYSGTVSGVKGVASAVVGATTINGITGSVRSGSGHIIDIFGRPGQILVNNVNVAGAPTYGIFIQAFADNPQLTVTNSYLPNAGYFVFNNGTPTAAITIMNNRVDIGTNGLLYGSFNTFPALVSDFNTFNSTTADVALLSPTYYAKAAWQALGYDLHSTF